MRSQSFESIRCSSPSEWQCEVEGEHHNKLLEGSHGGTTLPKIIVCQNPHVLVYPSDFYSRLHWN